MLFERLSRPLEYIAACGVLAVGLAMAPTAGAVTIDANKNLAGYEDGLTEISLPGLYDFAAEFDDASDVDSDGMFSFLFRNDGAADMVLAIIDGTVTQLGDRYFDGGVEVNFNGQTENIGAGVSGDFDLQALVAPNDTILLTIAWTGAQNILDQNGVRQGPIIDFLVEASVVPLPAGLVLFLSGLAGIGFLGRYKAKRRDPAIA